MRTLIKKKKIWICMFLGGLILSGCKSNKDVYMDLSNQVIGTTVYECMRESMYVVQYLALGMNLFFKDYAVLLTLFSIVYGILLYVTTKQSASSKKAAIGYFVVGIPLVLLGIVLATDMYLQNIGLDV